MPEKMVELSIFWSVEEAHAVKNRLEAEGIKACFDVDDAVNKIWYYGSATGGVKLFVAETDKERAEQILIVSQDAEPATSELPATAEGSEDCLQLEPNLEKESEAGREKASEQCPTGQEGFKGLVNVFVSRSLGQVMPLLFCLVPAGDLRT